MSNPTSPARPSDAGLITLLTDFGLEDPFVGEMKGAIYAVSPDARVVDLTHQVPAHDIRRAAHLLHAAHRSFPPGTVHVAVVDPGVGGSRGAVAVEAGGYWFVAPDNGILTFVVREHGLRRAYELADARFHRPVVSATFHGRDVFAPVAAWLTRGVDPAELGPERRDLVRLPDAEPAFRRAEPFEVEVAHVDRFGNVWLALTRPELERSGLDLRREGLEVQTPGGAVERLVHTYEEGPRREPFLLFNSSDHLEIACYQARAADRVALVPGDRVQVRVVPRAEPGNPT